MLIACITKCVCIGCVFAVTVSAAAESLEYEASTAAAAGDTATHTVAARSDIECATLCSSSTNFACRGFDFKEDAKSCEMRDRADAAFKKLSYDNVTVTRGSRTFRVIQQRLQGHVDFNRNWAEYENGFGDNTDFWIGLKAIHELTRAGRLLRVEATRWSGAVYVCEYSGFTVGDASTEYRMDYAAFINVNMTGDSLSHSHKGAKFSTFDNDNDMLSSYNCAADDGAGGFWYTACADANPSGRYSSSEVYFGDNGISWYGAGDTWNTLMSIRLMLEV